MTHNCLLFQCSLLLSSLNPFEVFLILNLEQEHLDRSHRLGVKKKKKPKQMHRFYFTANNSLSFMFSRDLMMREKSRSFCHPRSYCQPKETDDEDDANVLSSPSSFPKTLLLVSHSFTSLLWQQVSSPSSSLSHSLSFSAKASDSVIVSPGTWVGDRQTKQKMRNRTEHSKEEMKTLEGKKEGWLWEITWEMRKTLKMQEPDTNWNTRLTESKTTNQRRQWNN